MDVFLGEPLSVPAVSLVSSGNIIPVTDTHWEGGFSDYTEGCENSGVFKVCPTDGDLKTYTGDGAEITYVPYVIYAADKCATYSGRERDMYGRAERKLAASVARRLESELWLGTSGGNPYLANGAGPTTTVTASVGTPAAPAALGILDQVIADHASGRGMIHARPAIVDELVENNRIRRVGNIYLSPMDNIVVPGRGYPGTGPAGQAVGATEWMYATLGIVRIRMSEVIYTPPQSDQASQYDWRHNDRLILAERVAHAALDTSCAGPFALAVTSPTGTISYSG